MKTRVLVAFFVALAMTTGTLKAQNNPDAYAQVAEPQYINSFYALTPHHRFDFRARERDGVGLGQRLVGQSLIQPSDRSDQCSTKVIAGTVRTLQEAAGPGRVQRIAFASEEVSFDLFGDDGLGLCHLGTLALHRSAFL